MPHEPLVTERAWELAAAGASLRERWAAIAPEPAAHVAPISYDVDTGQLTVCPESAAWATKTRLEQAHRQRVSRPHGRARPADPRARHGAGTRAGRHRTGARCARRAGGTTGGRPCC
ncbi:DciA family protein [Streptomyces sp. NPDC046942]|uniref:DciA family protein n=1 Tax=Streptomyces sp. NPDC046942 TaxID=3155137 RepID=UPI0033F7ADF7